MTIKEAVAKLDALNGNPEFDHPEAERILCEYLKSHRASEVADAFNRANDRVGFWYA